MFKQIKINIQTKINNIQTTNLSNKETTHRLQIEHNNRSFLENSIHYHGDVGNQMLGVLGSVLGP